MSFERLFHPRGIAIVGASADLSRISGQPIKALKGAGYKGGIYPVNPKYPEMHGLKCYPDAVSIDGPCDVAIVAVPAAAAAAAPSATAARPASRSPWCSPPASARPARRAASWRRS